ncbi:3-oxoacyl-ACP synthase [Nonomuraea sp. PA05]|uniref:3-oxoacyl-ACP synthase n=1 Tax=Nonomuraea sp. PA05 TaxID=2604466 RepID=UPI0011D2F5C5|nr:3-oxoacyl-ACP synthase [Nonomuraea sp. PA05]TYB66644.1 3-oxoacyl-ACP synthase [Nonomuraea sp. PA05]
MRLRAPLAIRGAAVHLPGRSLKVPEALAGGLLRPEDCAASGYEGLPAAEPGETPETLAVRAARLALEQAATPSSAIRLLVHTWLHRPAHPFWSPAHHIADRLGAGRAMPLTVQQMSNGSAAALHTAAAWLTADPDTGPALITAADTFAAPGFDRWRGDIMLYGDAGCAVVIDLPASGRDDLHLVALASAAAPHLESVHRAGRRPGDPATPHPRETRRRFVAEHDAESFRTAAQTGAAEAISTALRHAGLDSGGPAPRMVLLPRVGARTLAVLYRPVLDRLLPGVPCLDLGHRTGHLGAGDLLANLAAFPAADCSLPPGEQALILSGGGGFTWTCGVFRRPTDMEAKP